MTGQKNVALITAMARKRHSNNTLAEAVGIHKVTVSELVCCRHAPLRETAERIAAALGVPADKLFPEIRERKGRLS